jgi:hypothetical protein
MKICSKCNIEKDDTDFYRRRDKQCKTCDKERIKLYRQNNPEKLKEKSKLYRQNNSKKLKEKDKLYYQNNPEKFMIKEALRRAKEKQLPFELQEDDIKIPEICPVLGFVLKKGGGKISSNSASLDRIIPEKGYVKGNIIVVSMKANTIKSNATPEEIIMVGEFYKKLLEAKKND